MKKDFLKAYLINALKETRKQESYFTCQEIADLLEEVYKEEIKIINQNYGNKKRNQNISKTS